MHVILITFVTEHLHLGVPGEIEIFLDNVLDIPVNDIDFCIDCYGIKYEKPR